jgi:hypothetical protein
MTLVEILHVGTIMTVDMIEHSIARGEHMPFIQWQIVVKVNQQKRSRNTRRKRREEKNDLHTVQQLISH